MFELVNTLQVFLKANKDTYNIYTKYCGNTCFQLYFSILEL